MAGRIHRTCRQARIGELGQQARQLTRTVNQQIAIRRKASAYHEAGHIVIALNRGIRVHSASIIMNEDYEAVAIISSPTKGLTPEQRRLPENRPRVEADLSILIAGILASQIYDYDSHTPALGSRDFAEALKLARDIDPSDFAVETSFRRINDLITHEIVDSWQSIVCVAENLFSRMTLNETDIYLAYRGAPL
jgi:hypothetical protein